MAQVVNVTDVPELPGAGMLHFDDGRPPLMALPEIAGDYREKLGLSDERLAMTPQQSLSSNTNPPEKLDAGGGVFGGAPGWQDNFHGRTAPAPVAPSPPPAAPAVPVPPQQAPQGAVGAPPPDIAAPPPPPSVTDQVQQARDVVAQRASAELIRGTTGGGPARAAGYAPVSQKVITEQGAPYDPQAAGQRLEADKALLDAKLGEAATAKQIADAQAAKAASDNLAAQKRLADQQAEIQRKQTNYQQQNQHMERELQDYSQSAQPDPNRFFSSRTPVANMMSAIGQALGAAGASLGHTQNFAFEYVQSQIKNDIAAQQQAYESGRADRNNALARFANYYHGDIDMAKAGLNIAMNKVAETEAQQFAAQSQSKTITAGAQALAAQFQADSLKREQDKAALAMGTTKIESSDKYHAAEGGGQRPLTPAEQEARLKLLPKNGSVPQGFGAIPAQRVARLQDSYGAKKEDLANARHALNEEARSYGLKINHDTGEVLQPNGKPADASSLDLPGVGRVKGKLPDFLAGPEGRAARNARLDSVISYYKAAHGIQLTPEQAESAQQRLLGSTDEDAIRSLQQRAKHLNELDEQADATAASIGSPLVESRQRAEKNVKYSRATGTPLQPDPGVTGAAATSPDEPDSEDNSP